MMGLPTMLLPLPTMGPWTIDITDNRRHLQLVLHVMALQRMLYQTMTSRPTGLQTMGTTDNGAAVNGTHGGPADNGHR